MLTIPLIAALSELGWVIQEQPMVALPEAILSRYSTLPAEVGRFLCPLAVCHNASQSVWFLTPEDYARAPSNDRFAWNELERLGEESTFWDQHFPFLYAVHSDDDYLAVCLTEESFGAIVHGFAPFWEEPSVIAPSFKAFLEVFTKEARADAPAWPYRVFLRE